MASGTNLNYATILPGAAVRTYALAATLADASLGCGVKLTASGVVGLCTANTDAMIGVLAQVGTAGDNVAVVVGGPCKVQTSSAIASSVGRGMCTTDGTFVPFSAGSSARAFVRITGYNDSTTTVAGQLVDAEIIPGGVTA